MRYIVKKCGGVWMIDANGACMSFEDYTAAIDTAQGAAGVFRRSKILSNQAALLGDFQPASAESDVAS